MKSVAVFLAAAMFAVSVGGQQRKKPEAATNSESSHNLELRLIPSELVDGVPEAFTFVLTNTGAHEIWVPTPSPCIGGNGTVKLLVRFTPKSQQLGGRGGGCGGALYDGPGILELVKRWRKLAPGESLSITYSRKALFDFQEANGEYEFWGEYHPPQLSSKGITALENAGIEFPGDVLSSGHLRFNR